jgi:CRISPR-associated protein Cas2
MRPDNRTTLLYVIVYDISSDRRRSKVHKILSGFGQWTQYSLFECYLSEKEYLQLRAKMDTILAESDDSVRFYPLCGACESKVETVGSPPPGKPELYLV